MLFCSLFYAYVIVVRSILCLRNHFFCIFYFLGFPGFVVIVILVLFGVFPGRGSACILWVLFMFRFFGFPQAGGLFVSFGFCLCFTFVVFPRPGDCLCVFAYGPLYAYVILFLVLH